jgi:hypothetical protein
MKSPPGAGSPLETSSYEKRVCGVNEKIIYQQDITGSMDRVLEHLKLAGQPRQALLHANLLLTNLMALLRPIRD